MIGVTDRERARFEEISKLENSHDALTRFTRDLDAEWSAVRITIEMCYDGLLLNDLSTRESDIEDIVFSVVNELYALEDKLIDLRAPGWVAR